MLSYVLVNGSYSTVMVKVTGCGVRLCGVPFCRLVTVTLSWLLDFPLPAFSPPCLPRRTMLLKLSEIIHGSIGPEETPTCCLDGGSGFPNQRTHTFLTLGFSDHRSLQVNNLGALKESEGKVEGPCDAVGCRGSSWW